MGEFGEYGESGDYDELAELRREVTQLRAALVRLSGRVVDPPDSLRRVLGLEIPEAPEWVGDEVSLRCSLGCGVFARANFTGPYQLEMDVDGEAVEMLWEQGDACDLRSSQVAVLKAAERLGVSLVARARVGIKALEGVST